MYEKGAGDRPDFSPLGEVHYGSGVLKGLPQSVQNKLKDTVGLERMSADLWRQHICHAINRYRSAQKDKQESAASKIGDKVAEQLMKAMEMSMRKKNKQRDPSLTT